MTTTRLRYIVSFFLGFTFSPAVQGQVLSHNAQRALDHAVRDTPAIAVILDARTGRMLAGARLNQASPTAPGSVLKPFFLVEALRGELIYPQTTVKCNRTLHIGGRNVDCTHPQSEIVFDAEQALAYSCNSYFAELAKRFTPENAVAAVEGYGVPKSSILRTPVDIQQLQLFVLGLEGISITPMQLAQAYRKLTDEITNLPPASPMQPVVHGLEDSVTYGMAHNAYVNGLPIAGKTGTASDSGQPWTHGWFAGYAPANHPKIVIIVYLPRGNGADAAHLAQLFFEAYKGALLP
jgi:cell division protein FtsI/penicillin-binding protein 2